MPAPAEYFSIQFTADPVQLVFFRAGFDRWLRGLDWPEAERVDALLAVSEACTNSVQHAYPTDEIGQVEVVGRVVIDAAGRRIVTVVRDHGHWRARTDEGYGLPTIRSCMDRVRISYNDTCTTVTMTSRPVPLGEPGPGADGAPDDEPVEGGRQRA